MQTTMFYGMKYLRPLMVVLLVQWAHTANLPCRICSPDSPDRSCIPDESMPPIEGVRVQSSICSDIENNHKEYHNKLCEKYPKPNGYYYECTVPGTSNTFSCRSSCGPPLEEVGKGLNLDLLKGGGLFGTFNSRPQNRGADLFDFNNFNNDKSRGNTNFGSFATLGSFNNNNNFNLFNTQGARTGNGNSRSNLRTQVPISGGISGGSTLPQGPPALNQVPPDLAQVPPQQPGQGAPDSAAQPPPIEIYPQGAPAETSPQLPPAPGSEVPENYAYDQPAGDYAREELAQDNPSEGPYSAEQGDNVDGLSGQEVGQNYDPNAETPKQVYPGVPPPPDAYPTDLSSDEVYPNGEAPQTNQSPERYTDSADPGAVQGGFPLPSQTNPEAAYPQGGSQSPPNPDQPQPPQDGSYPQSAGPSSGYPEQPQPPQDGSYPQSAGPSSGYSEQPQPPQDGSYPQSAGPSSGYPGQPQPPQDGSYPQSAGPSSGYPEQPQPPQDGSYPQSAGPSSGYPEQPQPPQDGSYPQSAGPSSEYPEQPQPPQNGSYPHSAGPSSGYPEQPQPPQNGPQGGGVARTPDVPDSSATDPYTPPANQYTPSASSDPAGSSVQGVALPSYSKKYPADGSSPDSSGASGYPPAGQAQPSPQKLPGSSPQPGSKTSLSAYGPSSDSQGALDAYESAKKDGGLTPAVVDAGSRGNSADPVGSGDGGKRAGYPVVVVDEGRKADVSRNTPTAPSQGLPPAINDVPDKKSQAQNSQTNVQFSSSSNDPNNNQLPPEAFQNPFNNPSSPFSRRTDQFESNPAFVGTSLFSEGFLDSPDRVISAGPKQRGPDAVDIGGYQIFPGFQQFEKTGDTDALGVNNNNNRQNNIFSLFTQPANQPTGQSAGAFGFGGSNPGRSPTPNNGFNGFSNGGRSTQTAGGVFDPNFLSNPGRSNFINPRQRFTGVLPGPSYSQAPGNGGFNNGFANQANNAPARFPANPAYPGAGGGSTRPSQTPPSFPGPQPAPGRGGASPFRNFGGTSNPSAGTGSFPTSGGRASFGAAGFPSYGGGATSGAAGFPSSGGGATSGAAGFPSSGGGATPSRAGVSRAGFAGFGPPNSNDQFGFPGSFGSFSDKGFDDDKFSKKYFSEDLFNNGDTVTTETEESSNNSQQTSVNTAAQPSA